MYSLEADLFFREPNEPPSFPDTFGVLYLLRRDAIQCTGIDPNTGAKNMPIAIWPGAMTVLAGVDLLGKFYTGSDKIGEVGKRFKGFLSQYFAPIKQDDENTIYQLRNALLHSFGLYSETKTEIFRFKIKLSGGELVTRVDSEKVHVDLKTLHQKFEHAIKEYQCDIGGCSKLQRNFRNMFHKYGSIYIEKPPNM